MLFKEIPAVAETPVGAAYESVRELTLTLNVLEPPAEIMYPALLEVAVGLTMLNVIVWPEADPTVLVALYNGAIVAPVEGSNKFTSLVVPSVLNAEDDANVPERVRTTLFKDTEPALFAVKVIVPRSSMVFFARPLADPNPAVVTVRLLRTKVIVLPTALESVVVATVWEEAPFPTTAKANVALPVSVDVAIPNVDVALSVKFVPPVLQDGTSPLRVSEIELDLATFTGVAKLNVYK